MPVTPFAGSRELYKWLVCKLFVLNILRTGLLSTHAFDARNRIHFICQALYSLASDLQGARWWTDMYFLMALPPLFLFFMNAVVVRGPDFPDQGPAFSSQLCVSGRAFAFEA